MRRRWLVTLMLSVDCEVPGAFKDLGVAASQDVAGRLECIHQFATNDVDQLAVAGQSRWINCDCEGTRICI